MRPRYRRLALLPLLVALASSCLADSKPAGDRPVFLIDQTPAVDRGSHMIDGVLKRVLPPLRGRYVVRLQNVPAKPRLRFSIGLTPEADNAKVSFYIVLRRAGKPPKVIYARDLSTAGWVDDEIDLVDSGLEGAELLFGKVLGAGEAKQIAFGVWANPTLLPATPRAATSVMLISIDTLRADHVGIYGYDRARTPTLDALARDNVWYANAYSASLWTYPSHASLLYGLYPASLPPLTVASGRETVPGQPRPKPIPELFRDAGYMTAGFTGGGFLSDQWAFDVGFDTYFMFQQPKDAAKTCAPERFDGPVTFDRARQWLRGNGRKPFFLFVHTYDVHDRCPVWPKGVGPFDKWPDPGPAGRERIVGHYDTLVAGADQLVAGLLEELQASGQADRTVVVVTGDHGEAFWEHGYYGHGCYVPYEPVSRVPLIVRAPGVEKKGRVDQPVSAVDVAPTLLALAGLPRPAEMQGYPLPNLGLESRPASVPIYVQCDNELAVRLGDHKLITEKEPRSQPALYDLASDPQERSNLLAKESEVGSLLQKYASEYWQHGSAEISKQGQNIKGLDESTKERLRALGYVP